MAVLFDRPVSQSARNARRLGVFTLMLAVISALLHRYGLLATENFVAVALVAVALSVLVLLLALAGLQALWTSGAKGGRAAFWALMIAVVILVPGVAASRLYLFLPPVYDVSTDLADPPRFLEPVETEPNWMRARRTSVAVQHELQKTYYGDLIGRNYDGAIDRVLAAVLSVADMQDISIVATSEPLAAPAAESGAPSEANEDGGDTSIASDFVAPVPIPSPRRAEAPQSPEERRTVVIQGVATDPVLRFRSDFLVRLVESEETTRLDVRSVSRTTWHDLGLNAWLARRFLAATDVILLGVAAQ